MRVRRRSRRTFSVFGAGGGQASSTWHYFLWNLTSQSPGVQHQGEASVTACHRYLTGHLDQLRYNTALEAGWPIATGAIEGACRHLVADRLDITGARWGLRGAEAVLQLRAVTSNGDLNAYWAFHAAREHERLYPTPDQPTFDLTA